MEVEAVSERWSRKDIEQFLDGGGGDPRELEAAGVVSIKTGADRPVRCGPGDVPMVVKSLRMPVELYEAVESLGHAHGFSGAVREALTEWVDRHDPATTTDEVQHALDVLNRALRQAA